MADDSSDHVAEAAEAEPSVISDYQVYVVVIIAILTFIWYLKSRNNQAVNDVDIDVTDFKISESVPQVSNSALLKRMISNERKLVVFYGSQTGNAEEFANRISKESARFGIRGMVADPEETDMEELCQLKEIPDSLAVFCMATYGEGDPTDNAIEFNEWLKDTSENLAGVNYAVFGLGNKTYEHYNTMATFVDNRLEELGATRVHALGLGDDDGNMEEDFLTWKEGFWSAVCEHFNLEVSGEEFNLRQYKLITHEPDSLSPDSIYTGEVARLKSYEKQRPPFDAKNPYISKMLENRELHTGGDRSCMHVGFNITDSRVRYETGDHLALFPENDSNLVNRLGELLNVDLDQLITLLNLDEASTRKYPFPCPCTYRTALTHYVDILAAPKTHLLKEMALYTPDEEEKNRLKLMSSASEEGKHLYFDWIVKANRTIIHVLEDIPSLKPPLDHLLEFLPRLQARYYSISSSPKAHPNSIHITAALVEYDTLTGRKNRGVATSWLSTKNVIDSHYPTAPIYVRKSAFRLPSKSHIPVIMIGPGTGLAPFRGFIQDRHHQKSIGRQVGETILYFGCRKEGEDFLYRDELKKYVEDNTLTKLYTAFSRDTDKKIYVQNLVEQNADEVWHLFGEKNGHIYVCGDARHMARDVHNVVRKIIREKGKMSEEETEKFMKKMESQKRYSADVWS